MELPSAALDSLNAPQRRAVETSHPRVIVVAGAGAGKTKVLTLRVARLLLEGIPAQYILCLTFTRAAAAEMKERIAALMAKWDPTWDDKLPEIRTIHSWGVTLLRDFAAHFERSRWFSIYDEVDREDIYRAAATDKGDKKAASRRLSTLLKDPKLVEEYENRLRAGNAVDFDMIELWTLRLISKVPDAKRRWVGMFRHVMVDEYQDTNLVQVAIVDGLYPQALFVVGDPRQGIYRFRGAEVATIIERARSADFEVLELVRNHRSVPGVVDLANRCVDGPWAPMEAHRQAVPGLDPVQAVRFHAIPGLAVNLLMEYHARGYRWKDMAILGRTWGDDDDPRKRSSLAKLRDTLAVAGIPANYCGGSTDPWNTDDGRAVSRVIRLFANRQDNNLALLLAEWGAMGWRRFPDTRLLRAAALRRQVSLFGAMAEEDPQWGAVAKAWGADFSRSHLSVIRAAAVVEYALEGLGVVAEYKSRSLASRVATIQGLVGDLGNQSVAEWLEWWIARSMQEKAREERDAVTLTTVHGAKGLEWPVVVLLDCRDGVYPSDRPKTTIDNVAEDKRVLYVGETRARDALALLLPEDYHLPFDPETYQAEPSPFLVASGVTFTDWPHESWGGRWPEFVE